MSKLLAALPRYRKGLTAQAGVLASWATLVITSSSGPITSSEWLALLLAEAGVLGVVGVKNAAG